MKKAPYLLLWQSLISTFVIHLQSTIQYNILMNEHVHSNRYMGNQKLSFTTSTSIQIGHSLSHGLINACYINSKIYVGPNPIQQLSFTASTSVHIGHGLINACCINSKIYVEPNHNQQLSITASTSIQMDHSLIKACYINSNGCSSEGIHVFSYTEAHTFLFYHRKKDFTFHISHFLINGSAKSTENIN